MLNAARYSSFSLRTLSITSNCWNSFGENEYASRLEKVQIDDQCSEVMVLDMRSANNATCFIEIVDTRVKCHQGFASTSHFETFTGLNVVSKMCAVESTTMMSVIIGTYRNIE